MDIQIIDMKIPDGASIIIGHAHFIKTVEDLYEAIVNSNPNMKFGIAFNEASGKRLIRYEGNDDELKDTAIYNAKLLRAGHTFVIMLRGGWPINVLNSIKNVVEVSRIYTATSNPVRVVVGIDGERAAILGVMDGFSVLGVEKEDDREERYALLRRLGYKK
ncbi:MAG: adenosine-specific kinase [Candidatus Anstonellales archaeon]